MRLDAVRRRGRDLRGNGLADQAREELPEDLLALGEVLVEGRPRHAGLAGDVLVERQAVAAPAFGLHDCSTRARV